MITLEQAVRRTAPPAGEDPIRLLSDCHKRIQENLDILIRAGFHLKDRRLAALHAIQGCFHFFDTSGILHTKDEEESLFPRLRRRVTQEQSDLLDTLERDHGRVDEVYGELRRIVEYLRSDESWCKRYCETAQRFRSLFMDHMAVEEAWFAKFGRKLGRKDLRDIREEMRRRRQTTTPSPFLQRASLR